MLSCPNCGGNLKFDIPSQQLSCEHCHTLFDPYDFDGKTSDAEESKTFDGDYEVTIFTCPQCGGEILSTDNAAAGFCSFCGASTILYSRISHEKRPNYIIPFQKTKEQCKEAYARRMKHSIFAPKELRDPSYIDSFRGIYMPYWAFYISQKGSLSLDGKKTSRRGDYIITDHYALTGDLDAYYKGLSYDASSSFDDNISEELAPYNLKGMKAFTRTLSDVEHSELDGGFIRYDTHLAAQSIDFAHNLSLGNTSDGGVATHLTNLVHIHRYQTGFGTHVCRGCSSLASGMSSTDNEHVIIEFHTSFNLYFF